MRWLICGKCYVPDAGFDIPADETESQTLVELTENELQKETQKLQKRMNQLRKSEKKNQKKTTKTASEMEINPGTKRIELVRDLKTKHDESTLIRKGKDYSVVH